MSLREQILITVDDLVLDFVYYDRKDADEELLQLGDIERAIDSGEMTADDIVERFALKLKEHLQ